VTAELLRHLLQLASRHLDGAASQQVVITVPAYFSSAQRAATLAAARLAGVAQVSLLQEPVAAALAFGYGKPFDAETLLVFDLGGGTFDLSVVDSFEGISEVLATGGNAALGGDDWDQALMAWLLEQQPQQHAAHSSSNSSQSPAEDAAAARAQLLAAVEAAKCQLSGHEESVRIPMPGQQQQQQQQVVELTRQQMHAVTASLRQQLWQPLQPLADACKLEYACAPAHIEQHLAAGQQQPDSSGCCSSSSNGSSAAAAAAAAAHPFAPKPRRLTAVLLVGGATRMPIIQRGLRVLTGLEPR
jgi:molecular chaperone DnaK (HSP70)